MTRVRKFILIELGAQRWAMGLRRKYFLLLLRDWSPSDAKQIAPSTGNHDHHPQTDPVKETKLILPHVIGGDAIGVERHESYAGHGIKELAA